MMLCQLTYSAVVEDAVRRGEMRRQGSDAAASAIAHAGAGIAPVEAASAREPGAGASAPQEAMGRFLGD